MGDGFESAERSKETGEPAVQVNASGNGRSHERPQVGPERWSIQQLKGAVDGTVPTWSAFPIHALPYPLSRFTQSAAQAIGCDPSYIALPLLAVTASAIGSSRVIRLKPGWAEPAVIWTASVGESGDLKSPAYDTVLQHVERLQAAAMERHLHNLEAYERERAVYEQLLAAWKRRKGTGDPPEKPEAPVCRRYVCSDTTVEALAVLLHENPRGLLLARDELAGWLGSFGAYRPSSTRRADVGQWLSMHRAGSITVDRKTGTPRTIYVRRAAVSITGTIQPEILRRSLGREHFEDGLCARLLVAMPPAPRKRWTEAEVSASLQAELERTLDELYLLTPERDADGNLAPKAVVLAPDAKAAWVRFYDDWAQQQAELAGDLKAAYAKLEGYAARLALIVHLCRYADGQPVEPDRVDAASIWSAIELVRWFGHETRRVYAILSESEDERDHRQLVDLIHRRGGQISPRELMRASRAFRESADSAEGALNDLAAAGLGHWDIVHTNGRPARVFRLSSIGDGDRSP